MNSYWDFHIHSGLSACASKDMTPNNILNMALIKGLDGIAITDHNSVENLESFYHLAKLKDIALLPGIELTTREEIHVLIFFEDLEPVSYLRKVLRQKLPNIKNHKEIFGRQLIYNIEDTVIGEEDKLLTNATSLSLKEALKLTKEIDGALIPAHVDRSSFSVLSNLGFIPPEFNGKFLEISRKITKTEFYEQFPTTNEYKIIQNSDAHDLTSILEREEANIFSAASNASIIQTFKKNI
jgi:3',5'-nucleoside bisphosphate phosphatase